MVLLRTLGGLTVFDGAGRPIPVPPKPLALLAYLAVARPRGPQRRDTLLVLFYPESDASHGRQALRRLLLEVRHAVGPDVLRALDREQLEVDPAALECDVWRFEAALADGDVARVLDIYDGPFLAGFHVDGCRALEEWLSAERRRLHRACAGAVETMAARAVAAGDVAAAVEWQRQLVECEPHASRATLGLMRALVASGDVAGALEAAKGHALRLRENLDAAPDTEVEALAARLRAGSVGKAPSDRLEALSHSALEAPNHHAAAWQASPATARRRRRQPVVVAVAAVLAVVAGAVAAYLNWGGERPGVDPRLFAVMPFQAVAAGPEVQDLARQMPTLFWMQLTGEFGPRATDPGTVTHEWEGAGGRAAAALRVEAEMAIAGQLGAGRLVRGAVTGAGDRLTITASLIEVPSGAVRVPWVTVRSAATAAGWLRAVDSLIGLLLARDANEFSERVAPLAQYPPDAVQAYLAGLAAKRRGDYTEAGRWYDRALAADSTFLLAALAEYDASESDVKVAEYVWAHRHELSPRERAYFTGLAGWRFGATRTGAEMIAQWDSVTRAWPEWGTAWTNLLDKLIIFGAVAGIPRWREWAWAAHDSAIRLLKGADRVPFNYGCELAWGETEPDTALLRQCVEGADWVPHWRLATLLGDTAEAHRWLPSRDQLMERAARRYRIFYLATEDGRGVADADRVLAVVQDTSFSLLWARVRGRHAEWLRWRDSTKSPFSPVDLAVWRVQDVLFQEEREDSIVRAAAQLLATIAEEDDEAYKSQCWSTLWAIRHGDTTRVRERTRHLRDMEVPVCAGLIEVLMAETYGGDLRGAVLRWDSIVRAFPLSRWFRGDLTAGIDNLLLARLLPLVGDTAGGLAASRRRPPATRGTWWPAMLHEADLLREEGSLAVMTGDTAGAIRAYDRYLTLRETADGPWREQRDQVRRELAALADGGHGTAVRLRRWRAK